MSIRVDVRRSWNHSNSGDCAFEGMIAMPIATPAASSATVAQPHLRHPGSRGSGVMHDAGLFAPVIGRVVRLRRPGSVGLHRNGL